jgi:phage shock protein B
MEEIIIVGIVFGSLILLFVIIFAFVLALKRTQGSSSIQRGGKLATDETRLMQEIYQGLSRMEERVEALETILLDRERNKKRKEREE